MSAQQHKVRRRLRGWPLEDSEENVATINSLWPDTTDVMGLRMLRRWHCCTENMDWNSEWFPPPGRVDGTLLNVNNECGAWAVLEHRSRQACYKRRGPQSRRYFHLSVFSTSCRYHGTTSLLIGKLAFQSSVGPTDEEVLTLTFPVRSDLSEASPRLTH